MTAANFIQIRSAVLEVYSRYYPSMYLEVKVKISLLQAVEAHRVARGQGSLPHYLDKRLTDGGRVVSPTRRPHFTPRFLEELMKTTKMPVKIAVMSPRFEPCISQIQV
jgi:hypothetical protein